MTFASTTRRTSWLCAVIITALSACAPQAQPAPTDAQKATQAPQPTATDPQPTSTPQPFKLESAAFEDGQVIPARFACTGENLSPALRWGDVPAGTQSLTLIFDDVDALGGSWVHWVLFNLPPDTLSLLEGLETAASYSDGSLSGANSWGRMGYGGPCPPEGSTHRYVFTLYALDTILSLDSDATNSQLLAAMDGHILAESELSGSFSR
ncbi:MAG: YbhB/YbcL family Raf kinase inhibitor-like protein [Chloroflexi bacterium]|nr:YbhB/YbcL family Raf kinase inhibitor-like protein [Chloroflexota bacterium]